MKDTLSLKRLFSIYANIVVVLMELITLVSSLSSDGVEIFKFYTQDSNIFALIACAACAVESILCLKNKSSISKTVRILKYFASCCVAVTFIVVVTVLAPADGPSGYVNMLFRGKSLFLHLVCPLITVISCMFLEDMSDITMKYTFYALIPTVIYAFVTLILNIARLLYGPYFFLHIYEQSIFMTIAWFVIILGGAYLINTLIRLANRKFYKN